MSTEQTTAEHNVALARHWIEVFNERDDAAEAAVRTSDYVAHAPASLEPKPMDSAAWVAFLGGFVKAFPDLKLTIVDAVGDGQFVAQRIEFELNRFVDGKVAEHWFQLDALTLLQQLGLVVIPGPRLIPQLVSAQFKKLFRRGG